MKIASMRGGILLCSSLLLISSAAVALGPGPTDDFAATVRDHAVLIDVLANDAGMVPVQGMSVARQPSHGTAQVLDTRVRYVPAPGFVGRDRFSYMAKKGRNVGMATVTVDVGEPFMLTLNGKVTDGGANARVTAMVGPHRYHAKAGTDGNYSIEVVGGAGDMVTLESSSGEVALLSIIGELEHLVDQAGADGVLTREENNHVQLTRLSTALAYLLQLANGGAPVSDANQAEAALGAMDAEALLPMSAAIKLVADGDYALPAEVGDTLALISDTVAFKQFLDDIRVADPAALRGAVLATLSDMDVIPVTGGAALAGTRSMLRGGAPGTVRVGETAGERLQLREDDGGGYYMDRQPHVHAGVTWDLVDGTAQVVFDIPRTIESYTSYPGLGELVREVASRWRIDITMLVDGGITGRDLVGIVSHVHRSYPDHPELADDAVTTYSGWLSHRDGAAEVPFLASEFPAVRGLRIHRSETDLGILEGVGLHQFNAGGTGSVLDGGQEFIWSLSVEGTLTVHYADGRTSDFRRLLQDGRKGDGLLSQLQSPGHTPPWSTVMTDYTLSSVHDGSLEFSVANLAKTWRTGIDISSTAFDNDLGDYGRFYVVLDGPGQTGYYATVNNEGIAFSPLSWQIIDGAMVARQYADDSGRPPACEIGVNGCYITQERRWVPVSLDGNRIYVQEELLHGYPDETGHLGPHLVGQRGNFYDIEELPAALTIRAPKAAPDSRAKR